MSRLVIFSGVVMDVVATALSILGATIQGLAAWALAAVLTLVPLLFHVCAALVKANEAPEVVRWDDLPK